MAQVWKCVNCGFTTWDPTGAGDHERKWHGELVKPGLDLFGQKMHYMEDLGE